MTRSVVGVALVVALAGAGFAMSFAAQVPSPVPVTADRPGTCHLAEDPNELIAIPSDTAPPAPCNRPHQTETMFVAQVTGILAASPTRPNGELLNTLASRLCYNYTVERAYLSADPYDVTYGIYSWSNFPTATAWARGVRTVACHGSTQPATPNGPTIDFSLAGVMNSPHSPLFRLCRTESQDVTCNLPHLAEDTSPNVVLPAGPYPGPDNVAAAERQACEPIVDAYLKGPVASRPDLTVTPTPITEEAWVKGRRSGDCWLTNANQALTTGTVRGGAR
ncbi:MAG: septum formation family protein [Acidimicrobiales bacterium]